MPDPQLSENCSSRLFVEDKTTVSVERYQRIRAQPGGFVDLTDMLEYALKLVCPRVGHLGLTSQALECRILSKSPLCVLGGRLETM